MVITRTTAEKVTTSITAGGGMSIDFVIAQAK